MRLLGYLLLVLSLLTFGAKAQTQYYTYNTTFTPNWTGNPVGLSYGGVYPYGTASQVFVGGTTPSWGLVPSGAMSGAYTGITQVGTLNGLTVTGSVSLPNSVITNAELVNATTTIGGVSCTLGSSCVLTSTSLASAFASPSPIGSTVANTGAFTNLSASGVVSGTGFTNLLATALPSATTLQFYGGSGAAGVAQAITGATAEGLLQFTQTGASAVQRTLDSKIKEAWVSVVDFGADPTGVSDSTAAWTAAYNQVAAAGGGTVYFPAGTYLLSSMGTVSQNGTTIRCVGGATGGGTRLAQTTTTGDFLTITGQNVWVRDCEFHPTVRITSGYQVKFSGAFTSGTDRVRLDYVYNGIYVLNSTETKVENTYLRYLLGPQGILYSGSLGNGSFGFTLDTVVADNPYPQAYGTVKAWATGTSYSLNDIVYVNGNIYQCSTAGTSAGAGGGPTGFPTGTTPDSVFTGTLSDNTVSWKFVATGLIWLQHDNYAYSMRGKHLYFIDGYTSVKITDTANTGSSYPSYHRLSVIESDHAFSDSILIAAGNDVSVELSYIGSSLHGNGINIITGFKGGFTVNTTRIAASWYNGVSLGAGVGFLVVNNQINSNSQSGSGNNHGVSVAAGVSNFVVSNNKIGTDPGIGSNNQAWGVLINTGASDYYNIVNNICAAQNVSGCVIDAGSGTHKCSTGAGCNNQ
jgi:Pectate lyase superfamily protein